MAGVVHHVKFVQTLEDWEMVALHTVSCGSFVDLVFQFVCKEEAFDKGRIFSLFLWALSFICQKKGDICQFPSDNSTSDFIPN